MITEDNVVVGIETVLYFTITDPRAATYEIANPLQAIEQLTVTTLRNVIGGLTLEQTLTAARTSTPSCAPCSTRRPASGGSAINRVEIKSVDPPPDIKTAMEKQMRAERDRRAAILTAEGEKQAQILTAEGAKQAAVLTAEGAQQAVVLDAEGQRQAAILRAEGEAKAIATVFNAIHEGDPTASCSATSTCRCCRSSPRATSNKVFVIPSEFAQAFGGIAQAFSTHSAPHEPDGKPAGPRSVPPPADA